MPTLYNLSYSRREDVCDLSLKEEIREYALEIGFGALGFTRPEISLEESSILQERMREGLLSPLIHRDRKKLLHPERIMSDLSSILVALLPYYHPYPERIESRREGHVSRYAWGLDYHQVVQKKLNLLKRFIEEEAPFAVVKTFVDTGPLLEKSLAIQAGLGFRGKNTLLITGEWGSWVFIGEILTNLNFTPDDPITDDCGDCTQCIDRCPTGALTPYTLDPYRCLSHATMWGRKIPESLRQSMGRRIWGCDTCQDVCPYNKGVKPGLHEFAPGMGVGPYVDLSWILSLSEEEFKREFASTPMGWKGLDCLQHNAEVVLMNDKGGGHGEEDFC